MNQDQMINPLLIASLAPLFIALALWVIFWKGLALWHSAQRGQYGWFIVMLVLNTAGILEIIYIFGVAKLKFNQLFTTKAAAPGEAPASI